MRERTWTLGTVVLALVIGHVVRWEARADSDDSAEDNPVALAMRFARAHDLVSARAVVAGRWSEVANAWIVTVQLPIFASNPDGGNYYSDSTVCVARDGRVHHGILPPQEWRQDKNVADAIIPSESVACIVARSHFEARGIAPRAPVVESTRLGAETFVTITQFACKTASATIHLLAVDENGVVRKLRTEAVKSVLPTAEFQPGG